MESEADIYDKTQIVILYCYSPNEIINMGKYNNTYVGENVEYMRIFYNQDNYKNVYYCKFKIDGSTYIILNVETNNISLLELQSVGLYVFPTSKYKNIKSHIHLQLSYDIINDYYVLSNPEYDIELCFPSYKKNNLSTLSQIQIEVEDIYITRILQKIHTPLNKQQYNRRGNDCYRTIHYKKTFLLENLLIIMISRRKYNKYYLPNELWHLISQSIY